MFFFSRSAAQTLLLLPSWAQQVTTGPHGNIFVGTKKVFSPAFRLHSSAPSAAITVPFCSVCLLQFKFPSLSTADLTSLVSLRCILKKHGFRMNLKQKRTMTLFL